MIKYQVMRIQILYDRMYVDLWNNENNLGVELSLRRYGQLYSLLYKRRMTSEPIAIEAIMYLYRECVTNGHF